MSPLEKIDSRLRDLRQIVLNEAIETETRADAQAEFWNLLAARERQLRVLQYGRGR